MVKKNFLKYPNSKPLFKRYFVCYKYFQLCLLKQNHTTEIETWIKQN